MSNLTDVVLGRAHNELRKKVVPKRTYNEIK